MILSQELYMNILNCLHLWPLMNYWQSSFSKCKWLTDLATQWWSSGLLIMTYINLKAQNRPHFHTGGRRSQLTLLKFKSQGKNPQLLVPLLTIGTRWQFLYFRRSSTSPYVKWDRQCNHISQGIQGLNKWDETCEVLHAVIVYNTSSRWY